MNTDTEKLGYPAEARDAMPVDTVGLVPDATTPFRSGNLDHMDTPRKRNGYGSLWRQVPRELGFLLLTLPVAVVGFGLLQSVFFTGLGLIFLVFGIFIVIAALYIARGFGTFELLRLQGAGRPAIARPSWERKGRGQGFWRSIGDILANGHYWTYLVHGMFVNMIVSTVTWSITIAWLASGLGGISYWFWSVFLPQGDRGFYLSEWAYELASNGRPLGMDPAVADSIAQFILGVIFLLTLPFVTRGLTLLHDVIARGLLSRWKSDDLQQEVVALGASREAALAAEDQSIRRLERDIHDGPQQRLIRLQMDLAAAERRLDADPEAAKKLIAEARQQAQSSLEELRALSRGYAPPILLDRGLVQAADSLAAISPIPVRNETALNRELRFPGELERNAYFVLAELLTNAAKHSGASEIVVRLDLVADGAGQRLFLAVADNGRGGAAESAGHGLSGLRDRLTGLRGTLSIESSTGAGTRVVATIPV